MSQEEEKYPHHRTAQDKTAQEFNVTVQKFASGLNSWLKETNPQIHATIEPAIDSAAKFASLGFASMESAMELVGELVHDLTGVQSFRIIPKSATALEVEIKSIREQVLPVKQLLAPFVELRALRLGPLIRFEALIDKTQKGLKLGIHEGIGLTVTAPIVGEHLIDIRGSGTLGRNERGELVLVVGVPIPGSTRTTEVALPIKHLLKGAQTIWKETRR
jgi:hypothetical protein